MHRGGDACRDRTSEVLKVAVGLGMTLDRGVFSAGGAGFVHRRADGSIFSCPETSSGEKADYANQFVQLDPTNRGAPLHTARLPPLAPHARRRFLGPSPRPAERRAVRRRRRVPHPARRPRPGRRQRPRAARGGVGVRAPPPRGRARRRRAPAARRARGARVDRDGVRRTTGMDGGPLDVLPIALRGDRPPVRPATRAAISTTLFGFFSDGRVVAFYRSRQTH